MMCPENPDNAKMIIDQILELLDEEHLKRQIDDPIDAVINRLEFDHTKPFTCKLFHKAIAKLVGHIYEQALRIKLNLSRPLGEAIFLLDRFYQGGTPCGYEAALLDAADTKRCGLEIVLARLVEIIKTREREKYIGAVLAHRLGPADWPTRCEIAAILIDRYRSFLSPELKRCVPEQLADEIPAFISNHLGTEKFLRQIKNSSLFVANF